MEEEFLMICGLPLLLPHLQMMRTAQVGCILPHENFLSPFGFKMSLLLCTDYEGNYEKSFQVQKIMILTRLIFPNSI
jgi:hypothetical protein